MAEILATMEDLARHEIPGWHVNYRGSTNLVIWTLRNTPGYRVCAQSDLEWWIELPTGEAGPAGRAASPAAARRAVRAAYHVTRGLRAMLHWWPTDPGIDE